MTLWFLVTRLLVHHTGEASSTIHTTSQYAYTDPKTEMHEHKHSACQAAAEQIYRLQGGEKIWIQIFHLALMFVPWTYSDK